METQRCDRRQDAEEGPTEKSMFFLSWLTARGSGTASVCLITLTDSPGRDTGVRRKRLICLFFLIIFFNFVTPTSENGLVHTQSCRFDGDDPDVSWHLVTN